MHPFRYITEVASTNTFSPSISKVLSIMPAAFSNCMEYEKPEQPPPTTPIRRPAGTGFCCPIISLTLETALGVSVTGAAFLTSGMLGVTSGTVVVAISISLALELYKLYQTRRAVTPTIAGGPTTRLVASGTWMLSGGLESQSAIAQGWIPSPTRFPPAGLAIWVYNNFR